MRYCDEFGYGVADDISKAGYVLTVISGQVGMHKNDFLRQVIGYGYPNNPWEKDNYFIRPKYCDLVREVLAGLRSNGESNESQIT